MPVLSAIGMGVRVGPKQLLDGVDLQLAAGEVTAIVGVNGAGKSTLLRVLAGELTPHAGHVELLGRNLTAWSPAEMARVRAVMTQHSDITFPFVVEEVVALGRFPHGGGESLDDYEIVQAALNFADAGHLVGRRYPTLSGGERQRVQLARALAQLWDTTGPRVLLLDEPSASLDLVHAHRTLQQVRRFSRSGACVVVVLHDLNAAARHADTLVMLDAGRVVARGNPAKVLCEDVLTAAYGPHLEIYQHPHGPWPVVLPRANELSTLAAELQPITFGQQPCEHS